MTASDLLGLLESSGGWGLSAVLMVVIWRLWQQMARREERTFALLNRQNEILDAVKDLRRERSK